MKIMVFKNCIFFLLTLFFCALQINAQAAANNNAGGIMFDGFFVNVFQDGTAVNFKTNATGMRNVTLVRTEQYSSYPNQQNVRFVVLHMDIKQATQNQKPLPPRNAFQIFDKKPQQPGVPLPTPVTPAPAPVTPVQPVVNVTAGTIGYLHLDTYILARIVLQIVDQNNQLLFYQVVWSRKDGIIFKQPITPEMAGVYTEEQTVYPRENRR